MSVSTTQGPSKEETMRKSGLNLSGIKDNNRALLLQLLCTSGQITRSELASRSKLSPMTITNIVNEFLRKNLVEEVPAATHAGLPGRTPMALQLSCQSPVIIGLFLSRSTIYAAVGDMSIHPLLQDQLLLEKNETAASILQKMCVLIEQLLRRNTRPVLGIGVATIGVVDADRGKIRYITDFYNIETLDIRDALEQKYDYPVYVANDMQAAGLCELFFGYGRKADSFLYVGITNGVGAALVSNRDLLECRSEMGHMSINCDGPKCTCGNSGCLELYVSTPHLLQNIEEACGTQLPNFQEAVGFASQNRMAYSILYQVVRRLSVGISNYLNLISVPLVVLGHDAYYLPDELIGHLEQSIKKCSVCVHLMDQPIQIVKSTFADMAPLYGSFCIVLQKYFRGEFGIEQMPDAAPPEA